MTVTSFAQMTVSGNVTDETGEPVIGASVVIDGVQVQDLLPTLMVTTLLPM